MDDSDASLVEAARGGSDEAFAQLVDRYLERCWNVAWRILHDRDRAADVAQEAMATAWQQLDTLTSPGSFGGWVLRIARNRALNRLEHERRAVPVDDDRHLEPTDRLVVAAGPEERVERDEATDLVWGAAAALGERDASVLDLHLRHGLGPAELADELGVTANNAHQVLFRLRNRLGGAIRAYVLWHHGAPRCDELARLLEREGATTFGPAAVRVIERHAADCPACEEDREAVLAPAALFGAVPLAAMPAGLADRVLGGLAEAGVPVPDALCGPGAPQSGATGDGAGDGTADAGATGDGGGASDGATDAGAAGGADGTTDADVAHDGPGSGGDGTGTSPTSAAHGGPGAGPGAAVTAATVVPLAAAGAGSPRSGERRRLVLASAAAAALLVAIVGLLAWGPGDVGEPVEVAGASTTTSTTDGTTTSSTTAPTTESPAPSTEPPSDVAPTASVVPTPTTPPPAPAPPAPTDPSVVPPPPPAPETTTTTPAPPPEIARFAVSGPGTRECSVGHTIAWSVVEATDVQLSIDGGPFAPVAAEGTQVVCRPIGTATLVATGPGGTDSETAVPPPPTIP